MRAIRSRRRRDDDGTSLPEMIVSMMIYAVIAAAVVATASGFLRATEISIGLQDQIESARTATEVSAQALRTAVKPAKLLASCPGCSATAFVAAGDRSVTFYANLNNGSTTGDAYKTASTGPSLVTLAVDGTGTYTERVQTPDPGVLTLTGWTYCDATSPSATAACKARVTTRTLSTGVRLSSALFTFYDANGASLPTASGALTPAQAAAVDQVELAVSVHASTNAAARPTTFVQRVSLPN